MYQFEPGSYVSHRRLPDLGVGEVLVSDEDTVRIRFASGNRQFVKALVESHLVVESTPPPAAKAPARARRTKKSA